MSRYVAAVLIAEGAEVYARVDPRLGGEDGAETLARVVWKARHDRSGIEVLRRASREAWRITRERGDGAS